MINPPTFIAIVPARAGSKGILHKNQKMVAGKPLISWTLEAAQSSKFLTKTVVSSDSEGILNIAKHHGIKGILRPYELATDDASSEPVVEHVLKSIEGGFSYDYIVLLQPTSPARTGKHIDSAIEHLLKDEASALISVKETVFSPFKSFVVSQDGYLSGIVDNKKPFMRRQDLPQTYMSNGAIYITRTGSFLENNSFYTNKTIPFVMDRNSSIDIDAVEDLIEFERMIEK